MTNKEVFEIESNKPFSESLIWQLNRDFYQQQGISAWSDNVVPHHMTSNSMVGKTYAELILGLLKDLAGKGQLDETVYLIELGAGHGRLGFHILKHLERLVSALTVELPSYCYVLSDIVEDNLSFFEKHPQFQKYLENGTLDVAYFDAIHSEVLELRYSKKTIQPETLNQPLVAIANYFFDSLPNDLFQIKEEVISATSVSLHSKENPKGMDAATLINNVELTFSNSVIKNPFYIQPIFNEILEDYRTLVSDTYLYFPYQGMVCLTNLRNFSSKGLMLLSMDKGFHEISELENKKEPDIVTHGSFSLWVNYHTLGRFCEKQNGKVLFPEFSTFHLDIACLLFLPEGETYRQTDIAYQRFVNDFGPDDFNSIKKIAYFNVGRLATKEFIALVRLSAYDSTFFIKLLPRLKQLIQRVSVSERNRIGQTMHQVWNMYFSIGESFDLAYELAGIFYDLGFYTEALDFFGYSINLFGIKSDIYYNKALCYYQLQQDDLFYKTLNEGKVAFPGSAMLEKLDELDMTAI